MPITYQWRRDGVAIDDTPPGTSRSATYTLVQADEGAVIDCVVTATNPEGAASVTIVAPRRVSNNRLIGGYEWDYAWGSHDAAASPGDMTAHQGGVDAVNDGNLTYYRGQYTGRLVTAEIPDIDQAIRPIASGRLEADIQPPPSTETFHARVIFRAPKFDDEIVSPYLYDIQDSVTNDRVTSYFNSDGPSQTLRFHSQTTYSPTDVIGVDLDLRGHWVLMDVVLSQTEHWMALNGVQYTDPTVNFPGFAQNTQNVDLLTGFDEADDFAFLFCGFRYGSFTFAEHEADYLSTDLRLPYPAIHPTISGSLTVGSQLAVDPGSWEGEDPVSFGYQWTRDGADISGATASTYNLVSLDAGSHIGCRVTGENASNDIYAVDIAAGAVEEGSVLELAWDHAWAAKTASRQQLIEGHRWNYAWSFEDRGGDDINPLAGGQTLVYQSGSYTGSASTGPLLDAAIDASRVGGAVNLAGATGARWNATDINVGLEDVHVRLIMERPTADAGAFFFWGDFGATGARDDYFWVTYTDNADPQLAYFTVTWYHGGAANIRHLYPDDAAGWCLIDIVLKRRADGDAELLAWANGGNVNFPGSDGALNTSDPFRGVPGDFLEINRAQDLDAAILFCGVQAGVEATSFTEDDHRAAFISSGVLQLIDYHTWDHAWDFSGATADSTISAFAGSVDLVYGAGTTSPGALTGPLHIGASRVDDALQNLNNGEFSVTGNTVSGGYHLRLVAHLSAVDRVQVLLDAPGLDIRTTTFNDEIEVNVTGWTTTTFGFENGWHVIDVNVWDDGGSLVGRIYFDGALVASVNSPSFTFNALGANWDVLHSGNADHFYSAILFLGVRALDETFDEDRAEEAYLAATGRALLAPLEPLVSGSVPIDPATGSYGLVQQTTAGLLSADVGALVDRGVYLDGGSRWAAHHPILGGGGDRHYRLVIRPRWGRAPVVGRVVGVGLTSDDAYLVGYVNEAGELVFEAKPGLSVRATIDRDRWAIVDVVTWDDGPEAVLSVLVNGAELEARVAGGHGLVDGTVGLGGYNGASGFIGDVLFFGWRDEVVYAHDAHYDLYRSTGLFQDIVAELDWNYAYDLSEAPATPGNVPELNGGVELTLTGSYTAGGSTFGMNDDVIGTGRVDSALTPGASTSFDADDRSFVLDLEQGVHIRYVGELYDTDPSAVLFQLGDTSTGSGITITRRQGGSDNFRFTVRTTTGTATDFDVSTIGVAGWSIVDFYIVPDGANTTLQVYIDGDLAETTWAQEWSGVDQTALNINLDNRPEALFFGVRSLRRNRLIDSYTWAHAWDWSLAPSTPGTVTAYAGGVDATILSGTYTTGAGTGGLRALDIGQERLDAAIGPIVNNLEMQVSDASLTTTEKVHFRGIVRCRDQSYLFMESNLLNPYVRFDIHPTLGPQWNVREQNAVIDLYNASEPAQWALVDVVFSSDGGGGTKVEIMVNGSRAVAFDRNPYRGMDNAWQLFRLNASASPVFDGDALFYGFRYGEDFTFEEHERDYLRSGLAHLWANLEWDNAWDFSEAPSAAGDIPAYAGTVDMAGSTPAYTIDQPTTPWTDEALGDAVDKAVLITGAGRNWETVNAALAHTGEYRVRVVARTPEGSTSALFEYHDDTSGTRDGPRIYTHEAATNAQQRLHGQHFDGATNATETIDRPSQGQWSLIDLLVDDTEVRLLSNGTDSGTAANPSTAAIGDEMFFEGESWEMLFLGVQKLSASSELRPAIHSSQWRAARRRNVIDRYDWTHAWDFSEQPRGGGDLPALAGGNDLPPPTGYVVGQTTEGLQTDGLGASRMDGAVLAPGTGAWNLTGTGVVTTQAIHMRAIFRWSPRGVVFGLGNIASGGRLYIHPSGLNRHRITYHNGTSAIQLLPAQTVTAGSWVFIDVNVRSDGGNAFIEAFINDDIYASLSTAATTYNGIVTDIIDVGDTFDESILFVGARYGAQISPEEHAEDYGYLT